MPLTMDITADDKWYLGVDQTIRIAVYTDATKTTALDVAGMALSWQLASRPGLAPTLTKTSSSGISVTGIFHPTPALNTQRVEVAIADTDTGTLTATTWWHELKRTDPGQETIFVQGSARLVQPVHLT